MFLMLHNCLFKKEDIDQVFEKLASEYIELGGTKRVEIYLVGGAAIVSNFDYRMSTIDIDALFKDNYILETAIQNIAKKDNLPADWLNKDFVKTPSYSPKIIEKAAMRTVYNEIIVVYSLEPKYLIAMKLKSSRPTGGDLDDIIKMIYELRFKGAEITYEKIIEAYKELYSDFSNTYDYFLEKAKEAFETPIEDFEYLFKKY